MRDRSPKYPGRVKLKNVATGEETLYDMTRADAPHDEGDPISKKTFLHDDTCKEYGFDTNAVPNDLFKAIAPYVTATIVVRAPVGSTVTATNGSRIISDVEGVDGVWTFRVQTGEWTVTAEKGYDKASVVVPATEVREYTVKLLLEKIYGAEWDGGESPVWSRTDDAASYPDPVPAVNNGTGWSPFDEFMPWAGMHRSTDENGNEVVSIPKFWYKWTRNGDAMKLQIADYAAEGFLVSPAHASRFDGDEERDIVYVSRYHCDANGKSVTNVKPGTGVNPSNAAAKLKGDYKLIDYATYWTICMLYLVEFADWRSQLYIGYGCSPDGTQYLQGDTDDMRYHTGTSALSRKTYGATQYRHIEDLWGNVFDWLSNVRIANNYMEINRGPHWQHTSVQVTCSRTSGYIKSWSANPTTAGLEYAIVPNAVVSENTYVRDWFEGTNRSDMSSMAYVAFGARAAHEYKAGLFQLKYLDGREYSNVGYRFVKLPGYST